MKSSHISPRKDKNRVLKLLHKQILFGQGSLYFFPKEWLSIVKRLKTIKTGFLKFEIEFQLPKNRIFSLLPTIIKWTSIAYKVRFTLKRLINNDETKLNSYFPALSYSKVQKSKRKQTRKKAWKKLKKSENIIFGRVKL